MNNCNNCKYRFKEKNLTPCRQCEADGDFGWWEHFDTRFVTEELEKLREELEREYDAPYESYPNTKIGLGVAIGYINKRLDELKGELVNGETTE